MQVDFIIPSGYGDHSKVSLNIDPRDQAALLGSPLLVNNIMTVAADRKLNVLRRQQQQQAAALAALGHGQDQQQRPNGEAQAQAQQQAPVAATNDQNQPAELINNQNQPAAPTDNENQGAELLQEANRTLKRKRTDDDLHENRIRPKEDVRFCLAGMTSRTHYEMPRNLPIYAALGSFAETTGRAIERLRICYGTQWVGDEETADDLGIEANDVLSVYELID